MRLWVYVFRCRAVSTGKLRKARKWDGENLSKTSSRNVRVERREIRVVDRILEPEKKRLRLVEGGKKVEHVCEPRNESHDHDFLRNRFSQSKKAKKSIFKVTGSKKSIGSGEREKKILASFECDVCHKIFKKKRYLRVHIRAHSCSRVCEICGALLASEFSLDLHLRRHSGDYSIFCEICKKGFYHEATLKLHMTSHTKEKKIACGICQKAFANRVYLRSHMKTHVDSKNRKKYACNLCKFETFYGSCYKEHRETHTGEGKVSCDVCDKLIRRQYMKTHMKIHRGDKNEICEFCGKAFLSRKYLTKHRRTHTGEKPYICFVCDCHFTQRSSLTKHLKIHDSREIEDSTKF